MDDVAFHRLPPVNSVLDHPELAPGMAQRGREATLRAVRMALEEARRALAERTDVDTHPGFLARRATEILAADQPALRPVLNASGVLLHTGLGRAPLAREAVAAVAAVARGYCNLEIDLETGERGKRTARIAELLQRLTGAAAATVVNNNAAATVLALRALAGGKEVIVSRGQLVEIGGSFRLPEIFAVSGARLREVGTTNKTRLSDYEAAIDPETAAILRVHASNYRIVGFTEQVEIAELAVLARARGLWSIDDIGSGALGPGQPPGVTGEPTIAGSLAAGADLVLCSGDKLLGGPQCGIMVGSKAAIARLEADPLMRTFRVDKMTLAALEATCRLALDPDRATREIPLWNFLTVELSDLERRAMQLAEAFERELGLAASVIETTAFLGGGSVPVWPIQTAAVRVGPPFPAHLGSESALARALRLGEPPVIARVHGGAVLFDLRAVPPEDDARLLDALRNALNTGRTA
ncbi:MAG TPA: L-seryl-tRNA(Sec) selenium transferase [Isosphaeraceae bacterium]|jgi:L-seryl-tRNA(Ser) seleniumtransferase|nr:L-seryl-tRNA(Sec) selenium transferase [Isosphaeraceae bacterium]